MGIPAATTGAGDDIAFAPMHALATRLKAGDLSAATLVDCYLQRIGRHDDKYHAFVEVYADEARAAAEAADRARKAGQASGALHGIPLALKDLIDVAGSARRAARCFGANAYPPSPRRLPGGFRMRA